MKRHKYKFRKEISAKSERLERHNVLLKFLGSQHFSEPLKAISKNFITKHPIPRSRVILYCLVTGRVRSTLSIINTSRHIFFWVTDHSYNTGFVMSSW